VGAARVTTTPPVRLNVAAVADRTDGTSPAGAASARTADLLAATIGVALLGFVTYRSGFRRRPGRHRVGR
jgi:hypothetical protein